MFSVLKTIDIPVYRYVWEQHGAGTPNVHCLDVWPYCLYAMNARGIALKSRTMFSHAVAQEVVVLLNSDKTKLRARVGVGWQPEVAQFLLDMFPNALEYGFQLSDIAELVSEDDFSFDLDELFLEDFDDDDFDEGDEDLE